MITVEFCPEGRPVSDFEAYDWLNDVMTGIRAKETLTFKVSTNAPIYLARLAIAENKINKDNIMFVFDGKEQKPNEWGSIPWVSLPEEVNEGIIMAMMKSIPSDDGVFYDGE